MPEASPRSYRVFDYEFAVTAEDPRVAEQISRIFHPFQIAPSRERNRYHLSHATGRPDPWRLRIDDRPLTASPDGPAVLDYLVWHVNSAALRHCPDRLLVHAGSVVAPGGGAVLLVGTSGAGKSTTVATLVRAGWGFLSDELAVIDPATGLVEPHPRPISLKPGSPALTKDLSAGIGGATYVPADVLRRGSMATPEPCRAVVRLDGFDEVPSVSRISRGAAVAAMAAQVLNLREDGAEVVLPTLRHLVAGATCWAARPGQLAHLPALLGDAVTASQAPADDVGPAA
jgi:hypothetical protein